MKNLIDSLSKFLRKEIREFGISGIYFHFGEVHIESKKKIPESALDKIENVLMSNIEVIL